MAIQLAHWAFMFLKAFWTFCQLDVSLLAEDWLMVERAVLDVRVVAVSHVPSSFRAVIVGATPY